MRATYNFDPSRECRFSTHATPWIKKPIRHAILEQTGTMLIPVYLLEQKGKFQKTVSDLKHENGRAPTLSEIANRLEKTEKTTETLKYGLELKTLTDGTLRFNREEHDLEASESDRIPHLEENLTASDPSLYKLIARCVFETLPPDEQYVLTQRFGIAQVSPSSAKS